MEGSGSGMAGAGASPLALVTTHSDRQRLASGNELLAVSGRVINPTDEDQPVPPLQAAAAQQRRASWSTAGRSRRRRGRLPPGASASFNSAEVNVPPGGDELTITLGAPRGLSLFEFDELGGLPTVAAPGFALAAAAVFRGRARRSNRIRVPGQDPHRRARLAHRRDRPCAGRCRVPKRRSRRRQASSMAGGVTHAAHEW